MPGNESEIIKILVSSKNAESLSHLGLITSVGAPDFSKDGFREINSVDDVEKMIASEDSRKKADVYINGKGVSLKQTGGSFSYNRLQRANILELFTALGFDNPDGILSKIDLEVDKFHKGMLDGRNRLWSDFFSKKEFKVLLRHLMMKGSPNVGESTHLGEFVLEAPQFEININNIKVFTFDEYFEKYSDKFKIAIRRQWVGQSSNSEHKRASGLAKKEGNAPWVYNDVAGEPSTGWREDFPDEERKTVYFLMIEKES